MNSKLLDKVIRQALWKEIQTDVKIMREYTSTWEHKPRWNVRSKRIARGYQVGMFTTDKRFIWVEKGTSVRWRRMSQGWQSKSRRGSLAARPGQGKALGFYKTPRKGIEARDNLETMADTRRVLFVLEVQAAINAASTALFSK